jgi:hypothetical protein
VTAALTPVIEEPTDYNEESFANVEFDLLVNLDSLALTTNEEVTPYDTLNIPLGSVQSFSSQVNQNTTQKSSPSSFNNIIDNGCTRHMFPFREAFTLYKSTPNSYVILANKSKVPCLGSGTVCFTLRNKNIILHDVLHVPKLRSPLLSVQCFR